jgi:predicted transcriptional regulator
MKIFTFRYEKNPKKSALAAMKSAIKTGKPDIRSNELICDSMDAMLKIMSKARFEVFAAIVENKPESLYELAEILEKDHANVLRDVKSLETLGLITLASVKDGARARLKPESSYDKIVIEFAPKKLSRAM